MSETIDPFNLAISDEVLADLRSRLATTRWPERETVGDWSQGVPLDRIKALCDYWAREYDWRRCEARLNALGQYRTRIDGLRIHFLHVRSRNRDAAPLILTHGWPGSVVEFLDVIDPLTDPAAHGADAADAFHVVVPSLPGFGFSDKPTTTGWGVERIAAAWITLMKRLGYGRFFAQGGDWGAAITSAIGMRRPPECAGVHLNMPLIYPGKDDLAQLTEAEQASVASMKFYRRSDSAYAKMQRTRPQTLGYGLTDSPAAQAAWIYEKFHAWTDNDWRAGARFVARRHARQHHAVLASSDCGLVGQAVLGKSRFLQDHAARASGRSDHLPEGIFAPVAALGRTQLRQYHPLERDRQGRTFRGIRATGAVRCGTAKLLSKDSCDIRTRLGNDDE